MTKLIDHPNKFVVFRIFGPFLKQCTHFLGTTYKLPEMLGSLYVRTNLLKFQEACMYTYKQTKISASLYLRTDLLDIQTYSNAYIYLHWKLEIGNSGCGWTWWGSQGNSLLCQDQAPWTFPPCILHCWSRIGSHRVWCGFKEPSKSPPHLQQP